MKYYHKFIPVITFIFQVYAADSLRINYSGMPYFTEDILNSEISSYFSLQDQSPSGSVPIIVDRLLDFYSEKGFPLAVVKTDSLKIIDDTAILYLNIESGEYVKYDKVEFRGNKITGPDALLKQSQIKLKSRFSESELKDACSLIYKTRLFKEQPKFSIIRTGESYGIMIKVEEKKYILVMLMGGYSAGERKDEFSGLAEIRADNIFGTFRKAEIKWERNGGENENLKLKYLEPFILNYLISSRIYFDQKYRNGYFLSREYGLEETFDMDTRSSVRAGISRKTIYTDSLYYGSRNDIETDRYSGGMNYSSGNISEAIPRNGGFFIDGEIATINIDIKDSVKLNGTEIGLSAGLMKEINRNYFLKVSALYNQVIFDDEIPEFNRIYFGGASSLRGYREDFFNSDIFIRKNLDLYFVPDTEDLAFNLFFENAFFNSSMLNIQKPEKLTSLQSYGGGIIIQFRSGEVSAIIGIPADTGFSESMIHIRYSVMF